MGGVDRDLREQVWIRDGGICQICLTPAEYEDFHVDHVWPKAADGLDELSNLRVTHPRCNQDKGALLPSSADILRTDEVAKRMQAELDRNRDVSQQMLLMLPQFEAIWSTNVRLPTGELGSPPRNGDVKKRLRNQLNAGISPQELLVFAQETIEKSGLTGQFAHWRWFQHLCKTRRGEIQREAAASIEPLHRANSMADLERIRETPIQDSAVVNSPNHWRFSVNLFRRPEQATWPEILEVIARHAGIQLVDGPSFDWEGADAASLHLQDEPLVVTGSGGADVSRGVVADLTAMRVSFVLNVHPPTGVTPVTYFFDDEIGGRIVASDGSSAIVFARQIDEAIEGTTTRDELVALLRDHSAGAWRQRFVTRPWHGGPNEIASLDPENPDGTEFYWG